MLRIALVQLVSSARPEDNLRIVDTLLTECARQHAHFVVLPENFLAYGSQINLFSREQLAELRDHICKLAVKYNLWIVAGSMPWYNEDENKPSSTCFVFNNSGEQVTCYQKMHLFDADVTDAMGSYRESDIYCAGSTPGIIDSPWGKFGLGICYDLRFPEYFRFLADQDVLGVFLPSAFTYVTGQAHWEVLLRARAIENQLFMFAANQGGEHSATRKTWGESMIVNPWGSVVKKTGLGEALVIADINLNELTDLQKKMPVLKHRKLLNRQT